MDRQTLCDWVHRYISGGVASLATAAALAAIGIERGANA
jgi:hypothetical protein